MLGACTVWVLGLVLGGLLLDRRGAPARGDAPEPQPVGKPRGSTRRRRLAAALVAVLALVVGAFVMEGTRSAYSVPTSNASNSLAAGTVSLTDDDGGLALVSLTGLKPGDSGSRCIRVSYGGSLESSVKLYATASSGTLGQYVSLTIQEGSGAGYGACSTFSPESIAYAGRLDAFLSSRTAYSTGIGSFSPLGSTETRSYRVTYAVDADAPDAAQGTTQSFDLRWEARSMTPVAAKAAGSNVGGELGDGTMTQRNSPVDVGTETQWRQISNGDQFSCAVRADGTLWCWGLGDRGRTGLGDLVTRTSPTQVGSATTWRNVSAGGNVACATRSDGTLWCWGYGVNGATAQGADTSNKLVPTQVGTDVDWATTSAGNNHGCAIKTSGTLWCWGANGEGHFGVGDVTDRYVPTQVGAVSTWVTVTAGSAHTCATRSDSTLWCAGRGAEGQLGDGTSAQRNAYVQVPGAWSTVSTNYLSTCAIKTEGTLWCWGYNTYGGLGVGDTTNRPSPTQVGIATTWSAVSVNWYSGCATRTDRTLWCWGWNANGQLGLGDTTQRLAPVQTPLTVRAVDAGYRSFLALPYVQG